MPLRLKLQLLLLVLLSGFGFIGKNIIETQCRKTSLSRSYIVSFVLPAHGGKILNGEKVLEGEMPFMASLQLAGDQHTCGGFLISEDIVLTAAHCEEDDS